MSPSRTTLCVAALPLLVALLFSSTEGQLQAAWKFSKEGNTDNQAFISVNGHVASMPPILGHLFGGVSSINDFLGLVQAAGHQAKGGANALPLMTSPATNGTLLPQQELQDDGLIPAAPAVVDNRPLPGDVDVGEDGFLYFRSNETFDRLPGCQSFCNRFRGFRLAIAKTNETMIQMRKYNTIQVNLAIERRPDGVHYVWGDGSDLDRSLLLPTEPKMNNAGRSDRMAIYGHILDDAECCYGSHKTQCLCQGTIAPTLQ